jgi:hypothetical protein
VAAEEGEQLLPGGNTCSYLKGEEDCYKDGHCIEKSVFSNVAANLYEMLNCPACK